MSHTGVTRDVTIDDDDSSESSGSVESGCWVRQPVWLVTLLLTPQRVRCVRAAVACVLQMRVRGRSGWLQRLVSGAGCSGTLCRLISQDAVSVLNAC